VVLNVSRIARPRRQGVAHRADGKVASSKALAGRACASAGGAQEEQLGAGQVSAISRESAQRVRPGASLGRTRVPAAAADQHLHPSAQVAVKQRFSRTTLASAKVKPSGCCGRSKGRRGAIAARPAVGSACGEEGYRAGGLSRAQIALRGRHGGVPVLPPHVSAMLLPLRDLIGSMEQRNRLPQIEVAVGTV